MGWVKFYREYKNNGEIFKQVQYHSFKKSLSENDKIFIQKMFEQWLIGVSDVITSKWCEVEKPTRIYLECQLNEIQQEIKEVEKKHQLEIKEIEKKKIIWLDTLNGYHRFDKLNKITNKINEKI